MTRIDKIKNMDSLELGVFLEDSIGGAPWCKPSDVDVDPITKECKKWDCYECAREWLEEEIDADKEE